MKIIYRVPFHTHWRGFQNLPRTDGTFSSCWLRLRYFLERFLVNFQKMQPKKQPKEISWLVDIYSRWSINPLRERQHEARCHGAGPAARRSPPERYLTMAGLAYLLAAGQSCGEPSAGAAALPLSPAPTSNPLVFTLGEESLRAASRKKRNKRRKRAEIRRSSPPARRCWRRIKDPLRNEGLIVPLCKRGRGSIINGRS